MNTITREELAKLLDRNNPEGRKSIHLLDVSSREKFAKEHIDGALNVPLEEAENKKESALPTDRVVVCYGESPEDAEKAAAIYAAMGYKTRVYREGLAAWKEADLPIVG